MYRVLLHIVSFMLLSFFSFIKLEAQEKLSYQISVDEEIFPGKASCMLLSKAGFFYVGTNSGLFMFDGIALRPFLKNDTLRNITSIYETENGKLWIGCSNGSIFSVEHKKATAWLPQEGLGKAAISTILQDQMGRLWFATKGEGIYTLHQNKLYNLNTDDGLADNYVYDLQLINGRIFAATDNGISNCWFDGSKKFITNYNTSAGLTDNIVQHLTADKSDKNKIWLGFQNGGLGLFNLSTEQSVTVYSSSSAEAQINKILPLDHELWLACNNGLTVLSKKDYRVLMQQPFNKLQSACKDWEANVWLLNSNHIYKTRGEQVRCVLTPEKDENREVHDLLQDEQGAYWITVKGGVARYTQQKNGFVKEVFKLGVNNTSDITCLYRDKYNHIWVGTMGNGLFMIDPQSKKTRHLKEAPGFEHASILSITGTEKHVWITGLEGVLKATLPSTQTSLNTTCAFELINNITGSAYIYQVLEDSKGRAWFATDGKGIALLQNGSYRFFGEKEGLTAKVVYSLAEDSKGNIWCNTLNNGLFRFNGKEYKNYGSSFGLPALNVSSLTKDNAGNIFCVTQKGVFLIQPETEMLMMIGDSRELGQINSDLNSTFSGSYNLFHTAKGVFAYHFPSYKKVLQPQTTITAVSLFLDELANTGQNQFAHNENNLSFSFSGYYLSDPQNVQYQYKLEGYNNNWQTTKDGFVNFPKLQPGFYTFRVRSAVTGNFTNAAEAVYAFTIKKPFWTQWWFLLLSIASVTAFLIYIIKEREEAARKWQLLQTEKLQSQYETLKNQVNPHFLFNSFNTLLTIIEEDPAKAGPYVAHLSDFYRSIVNFREKDLISLEQELRIIEDYFFIQKKRFGDALQLNVQLNAHEKTAYKIPPLSLQLLAENAVKHNAVSKENPIHFRLFIESDYLVAENNLQPKLVPEKSEGLGLQNIKNRFKLLTGKDIILEKTEHRFIVKLPLISSI
jgi:ligand-binding sensor domain-containing protein